MNSAEFTKNIAQLYVAKPKDPRVLSAVEFALAKFTTAKPWIFCRGYEEITPNSSGVFELPADFDGVITMRQNASTNGGWIQPWQEEKYDYNYPKPSTATGSYAVACKIYSDNGIMYGKLIPEVSDTVYLTYKRLVSNIADIPTKLLSGLVACTHQFMMKPSELGYKAAVAGAEDEIKKLWKIDRQQWTAAFLTYDDDVVANSGMWWGVWNWY